MNKHQTTDCGTWKYRVLLAASGELSTCDSNALDEHLLECPNCREFANEARVITDMVSKQMPAGPSNKVLRNIHEAAAHATHRPFIIQFPVQLRVALGAAAALAIVAGIALRTPIPSTNETTVAANFESAAQVASLALVLSEADVDSEEAIREDTETAKEDDLHRLAQRLLQLQGFEDDLTDEGDLFLELPSIDLQSRSTLVLQHQICV